MKLPEFLRFSMSPSTLIFIYWGWFNMVELVELVSLLSRASFHTSSAQQFLIESRAQPCLRVGLEAHDEESERETCFSGNTHEHRISVVGRCFGQFFMAGSP